MKHIHAFTETHVASPGYISIGVTDDQISISVRTRTAYAPSMIEVSRDQLAALHADIGAYLKESAPDELPPRIAQDTDSKPTKA